MWNHACQCQCQYQNRQRALQSAIVEVPEEVYDDRPVAAQCILSRALHRYSSMSSGSFEDNCHEMVHRLVRR